MSESSNQQTTPQNTNAWLVVLQDTVRFDEYFISIHGNVSTHQSVQVGDWLLMADERDHAVAVGRVYRIRRALDDLIYYLDKHHIFDTSSALSTASARAAPRWESRT